MERTLQKDQIKTMLVTINRCLILQINYKKEGHQFM